VKFRYSGIGNFGVWSLFLGIINEITWSVPERTFSHYLRSRTQDSKSGMEEMMIQDQNEARNNNSKLERSQE